MKTQAKIVMDPTEGTTLVDAVVLTNLASSRRESARLIKQGAISLNFKTETNPSRGIYMSDLLHTKHLILGRGKNGWAIVTFNLV